MYDEEEQGVRTLKKLSGLQCYCCGQFEQHCTNKPPHTKENSTYPRNKSIKSGTLNIKYGLAQMHIADDLLSHGN